MHLTLKRWLQTFDRIKRRVAPVPRGLKTMAVMMQGFYWDCAKEENKLGEWWNYLAEEIPKLGKNGAGFNSDRATVAHPLPVTPL